MDILGRVKEMFVAHSNSNNSQITNLFDGTFEENERAELKPIQDNIDVISFSHKEFNSNNVLTNDKIDFNWVGGSTCSWLFESLTELERLVLKKAFVDEMSVRGIAQEMGVTSVIIKSIIEKCKATIQANLEEEELTDE
jgi:DNA-directed RNA polymerase specialized sigma subunit